MYRSDAHHYVVYLAQPAVSIDSGCGTRQFILRVSVVWVSGQPLKIDGVRSATSLTNAIAYNRF